MDNILNFWTPAGFRAAQGSRPIIKANMQSHEYPRVRPARGIFAGDQEILINSLLRKDEWEDLDDAVVRAARDRLVGVGDLFSLGLTKTYTSMGVLTTQWNVASQMTAPQISMSGASASERDRVDFNLAGRPLPVIHKEYEIGLRQMEADRLGGGSVDSTNAVEAGFVVAEAIENMYFNGVTSFTFNGDSIAGLTTEANRNTDTATNYGGGDWGTLSNIVPTVEGMITAANGDGYYGPFGIYAARTQYNQAALNYYTDGSGDTPAMRIRNLDDVQFFRAADKLAAGVIILVQLSSNVVDIAYVTGGQQPTDIDAAAGLIRNLEWTSGDGMTSRFKVLAVAVPRVKSDYGLNSGIVHATGA